MTYTPTERNQAIFNALQTGTTYADAGAKYGISRQRVKQLVDIMAANGLTVSTKNVRATQRENLITAAKLERYGSHHEALQADPEMRRRIGIKLTQKKHNARAKGLPCSLTISDLYPLPEVCPALGIRINYEATGPQDDALSIDRLDPEKGYVPGNVVLVSMRANRMKNNGTLAELQKLVTFYSKHLTNEAEIA